MGVIMNHRRPHPNRPPHSEYISVPNPNYPYGQSSATRSYPTRQTPTRPTTSGPSYTYPIPQPTAQALSASNLQQLTYHATPTGKPTITLPYTAPTRSSQATHHASREAAKSENRKLGVFLGIFAVWVLAWCVFVGYYVSQGT